MKKRIIAAVILMGFSGLVAQVVLLRELMIAFHGNELSIGIVLANWLMLEAVGAYCLGSAISRARRKLGWFVLTTVFFTVFFLGAIVAARSFREFMPVAPGEGFGLLPMFWVSFLILLPVSVTHGALFTSGCRLFSLFSPSLNSRSRPAGQVDRDAFSIARVYVYETAGTFIGGAALIWLISPLFHSIEIALILALLNIGVCVTLLQPFRRRRKSMTARIAGYCMAALLPGILFMLAGSVGDQIHTLSVKRQWQNQELVYYRNSPYGNIAVVHREGEYTFFTDGLPAIAATNPDWVHVEEFVHLPMLAHPDPRTIIVLGRGAGGVINEILKHNVDHVDYTEIDPLLIEVLELFSTPLTEKELRDPRVHARRQDGRLYLKRSSLSYDVIFSGFTNPATLEANRFFTRQFFTLARDRLAPDGILVFGVPGSLTYMTPELANLNALVLNTIESVYPFVRVIPGDGMNYYLASGSPSVKEIGAGEMMERAAARQIDFRLFTTGYLEYRLHERWLESFRSGIAGVETEINEDFSPRGVFYSMVYWNEKFSPAFNRLFKRCEDIGLMMPAILLTALSALFFLFRSRIKNPLKPSLSLCVISTGFAGMIFDLMLIFAFQIIFGYVFYWVGILVAAFMAGVMAGGLWMTAHMKRVDSSLPALIRLETALVIFAFSLPWVFVGAGGLLAHEWGDFLLRGVFVALSMASGVLVGAQFPLANREYLKFAPNLGKTAGLLYGADLFGGWIGGIIGGVALLPVLGLMETSLLVVMLKVFSLLILLAARNRGRIAAA